MSSGHSAAAGSSVDDAPDRLAAVVRELAACRAESHRLADEIAELVHHDATTGLPNLAGMAQHIELAIDRLDRTGEPFGLMLVRIPELRLIADREGPAAHAAAQRRIGKEVIAGLRAIDHVGLAGGCSFMVTLPELVPDGVGAVVDRVERALEASPLALTGRGALPLYPEIGVVVSHAKTLVDVPMLLDILFTTALLAKFRAPTLTVAPPLCAAGATRPVPLPEPSDRPPSAPEPGM